MKTKILSILLALNPAFADHCYVTKVKDGDTIECNGNETVRLIGLQTPEEREANYYYAGYLLSKRALRRDFTIWRFGKDRYKRTLGILEDKEGAVNVEMRKKFPDPKYDRLLNNQMLFELRKRGWK